MESSKMTNNVILDEKPQGARAVRSPSAMLVTIPSPKCAPAYVETVFEQKMRSVMDHLLAATPCARWCLVTSATDSLGLLLIAY